MPVGIGVSASPILSLALSEDEENSHYDGEKTEGAPDTTGDGRDIRRRSATRI